MSRGAIDTAPRIEPAHHAHTRPFECRQSYDPYEEKAQEPVDDTSLEELSEDLRGALISVNRCANSYTSKRKGMPKEEHSREEKLPAILAATIKNLQDFEQALRRWNSEARPTTDVSDANPGQKIP